MADTATTFAGIHNENEFYSHHYLSEIFTGDIRDTVARWRDSAEAAGGASAGARTPYEALRALARDYLQFRRQFALARRHEARVGRQRRWFAQLLDALGYGYEPHNHPLEDGDEVPVLFAGRQHGSVSLLILGAYYGATGEDEDPLDLKPHPAQYHGEAPPPEAVLRESWSDSVTRRIFGQPHPPRWIILLSPGHVILIERGKWTHNRLLRFDLDDVLGRREDHTLKAAAAQLHRECLLPEQGASLLDSLDDNSHKHAFAVSEDLKYALRESIELIGNETIWYLREVARDRVYRLDDALAGELGLQALRYMYRLLFLFYIEARPDLGYAPIEAEAYRKGYGLERLRDLEMVRLTSEESLDGYYLHHSIQTLFRLIHDGFEGPGGDLFAPKSISSGPRTHGFTSRALDSRLFRDDAMPLLNRVKFRNRVLQKVIRLMSLSRPAKGRRGRRGRISYALLGINQLGAVYEVLLSYRGFFAEEDFYEVKKPGDASDDLASAWFVPARDLGEYHDEEKVYDRDDQGRKKLREDGAGSGYAAVVVDEAQDMGAQAFSLIRSIAPVGRDDLFIAGDGHQRIYGRNRVVMGRCGIDIRGRSRKLRLNCRTTEETRRWATHLLAGRDIDDLDGGSDDNKGTRSLTRGPEPVLERFDSREEQSEFLVRYLSALQSSGDALRGVCIVARTTGERDAIKRHLNAQDVEVELIERDTADDGVQAGVRLATMHRVKGLEFDRVVMATMGGRTVG